MKYAGQSKHCQTCPRCQKSPDTHSLAPIMSSPATDRAAKAFLDALHKHAGRGMDLRLETAKTEFMVGALVATVDSRVVKLVAHSGSHSLVESKFTRSGEFDMVKVFPTALDDELCYDVNGTRFRPSKPRTQCAASKLLNALFDPKGPHAGTVKKIEMSEIFYRDFRHNGKKNTVWSTNDTVPSCDKCATFLPELLCDLPNA